MNINEYIYIYTYHKLDKYIFKYILFILMYLYIYIYMNEYECI